MFVYSQCLCLFPVSICLYIPRVYMFVYSQSLYVCIFPVSICLYIPSVYMFVYSQCLYVCIFPVSICLYIPSVYMFVYSQCLCLYIPSVNNRMQLAAIATFFHEHSSHDQAVAKVGRQCYETVFPKFNKGGHSKKGPFQPIKLSISCVLINALADHLFVRSRLHS